MKQSKTKKTNAPEAKISYTRFAFWFPILYGVVNVILMAMNLAIITSGGRTQNVELALLIQRIFTVLCVFSPTAFILMLFLSRRHMARYPNAPSYYSKLPGIFSIMVLLAEVVYVATFMIK